MIGALVAGITGSGGASLSSYESIATATGTGSSGTITFSSIPSGFKYLQIRGIYADGGYNLNMRFNSDSASNYARHTLNGSGSAVAAAGAASQAQMDFGAYGAAAANTVSACIIDILDYGSTSKYKTVRVLAGYDENGSGGIWISSGLWQSTSAVSSLSILNLYGSYYTRTQFALYGIKEA